MSRHLTADEKRSARGWWPRMNVDNVIVTDEATNRYNCLAWALGITNSWVWPWGTREPTKAESDTFMRSRGFRPVANGEVAVFGGTNNMKHYSISGPGHGPRWESKAGSWLRIQHGLGEMEGGTYGVVRGFYTHGRFYLAEGPAARPHDEGPMPEQITEEDLRFLDQRAAAASAELRQEFDRRYAAWKATWSRPWIMISSCPGDYIRSQEFLDLMALGSDILPLLMNRLRDPADFFTLQAVELLAPANLVEAQELDDPAVLAGEQDRAQRVLKRWIASQR